MSRLQFLKYHLSYQEPGRSQMELKKKHPTYANNNVTQILESSDKDSKGSHDNDALISIVTNTVETNLKIASAKK